jgi:hypothetical protein
LRRGGISSLLPRGAGRRSGTVPFKRETVKDFAGKRVEGTVTFSVVYGHPDREPVRRLRMVLAVILAFDENGHYKGGNHVITEESDTPI